MSSLGFKALDIGDVTHRGTDPYGCVLAVSVGVLCATTAGTFGADAIKNPTQKSRLLVGAASGGVVAACASNALTNRNAKLSMVGLGLGICAGAFAASCLKPAAASGASGGASAAKEGPPSSARGGTRGPSEEPSPVRRLDEALVAKLAKVNKELATAPYRRGAAEPSADDAKTLDKLVKAQISADILAQAGLADLACWFEKVSAFPGAERAAWPEPSAAAAPASKATTAMAASSFEASLPRRFFAEGLDRLLTTQAFICGPEPCAADARTWQALAMHDSAPPPGAMPGAMPGASTLAGHPHAARWFSVVEAFSAAERAAWPEPVAPAAKPAEAAAGSAASAGSPAGGLGLASHNGACDGAPLDDLKVAN